jgi:hypothetical protein
MYSQQKPEVALYSQQKPEVALYSQQEPEVALSPALPCLDPANFRIKASCVRLALPLSSQPTCLFTLLPYEGLCFSPAGLCACLL